MTNNTIDADAFKALIHEDEAFGVYLDRFGASNTLDRLQEMNSILSTQIAKWGDERVQWYKRAKALQAVVKNRMDQVHSEGVTAELEEWKDVVFNLITGYQETHLIDDTPDFESLESVKKWVELHFSIS